MTILLLISILCIVTLVIYSYCHNIYGTCDNIEDQAPLAKNSMSGKVDKEYRYIIDHEESSNNDPSTKYDENPYNIEDQAPLAKNSMSGEVDKEYRLYIRGHEESFTTEYDENPFII